jgi:hypothetical protein
LIFWGCWRVRRDLLVGGGQCARQALNASGGREFSE